MDSDDQKEEIRARIDLEELIGQHVRLQRSGSRLKGLCPFHDEKTPSFFVDPARGFWHCFGCGAGGDLYAFVMQQENLDFPEALQRMADRAGVRLEKTPQARERRDQRDSIEHANRIARDHFIENLYEHPAAEHAREYVRNRGFKGGVVKGFEIGFALESWDDLLSHLGREGISNAVAEQAGLARTGERGGLYDAFRNRVIFPIVDVNDRVIGFGGRTLDADNPAKYVNSQETPLFQKRRTLYGLNVARQSISDQNRALIVEGYTDVVSLHQAGIGNVVAGLGTALAAEQLKLLGRYCDEIVFVYDGDSAGAQAALRNLEVLEGASARVSLIVLPEGMDPDDFVRTRGREEFEALVESRVSPVDYQMDMIFAAHADEGADGRAQAAQEAAEVLMKVPDNTQLLAYLTRAADLFGRGNPQHASAMERVIRMEMNQLIRGQGREHRSGRDSSYLADTLTGVAAKGIIMAETELLSLALDDEEVARQVVAELTAQDMNVAADQAIMLALKDQLADGGALDASALVDGLPHEEGVRERGVELAVAEVQEHRAVQAQDKQDMIRGGIEVLRAHRIAVGQVRKSWDTELRGDTELAAEEFRELEGRIQEKLNSGELKQDDPEFVRYQELKAGLRQVGESGYAQDFMPDEEEEEAPSRQKTTEDGGEQRTTTVNSNDTGHAQVPPSPGDPWETEEGDPFAAEDDG